jgi:hypothetical protein
MNGRHFYAHKVACNSRGTVIPEGLEGCHSCDNPSCCNPSHIFAGTQADNLADMTAKGRRRWVAHKGEKCGAARLLTDQVIEIRRAYDAGEGSQRALARKHGCAQATIGRVLNRDTWKHVQ